MKEDVDGKLINPETGVEGENDASYEMKDVKMESSSIDEPSMNGEDDNTKKKKKYAKKTAKVKIEDPNAPKRPRTAYTQFMIKRRKYYATLGVPQKTVNTKIAQDWSSLSQEEKQEFFDRAAEEKRIYDDQLKKYQGTDEYKEFQKKKTTMLKERSRKRKVGDLDDDDDEEFKSLPSTSMLCPLIAKGKSKKEENSNNDGFSYSGPIFSTQFIEFNKARDSYRRQMAKERATLEHELDALRDHDPLVRIEEQEKYLKHLDKKITVIEKVMTESLRNVNGAKDKISDLSSIVDFMKSVETMGLNTALRKSVRECLSKVEISTVD